MSQQQAPAIAAQLLQVDPDKLAIQLLQLHHLPALVPVHHGVEHSML